MTIAAGPPLGAVERAPKDPVATAVSYAVFDLETTGLDPMTARVVECAVVHLDADARVIEEWSSLIDAPGDDEPGASWLHGISRASLVGAPSFSEVAAELVRRLSGRIVVGHVLAFDLAHLGAELRRIGAPLPRLGTSGICTRELADGHLPKGPRSLISCCAALGVPTPAAHTALGDARATAAIFRSFLVGGAVRDVPARAELAKRLVWPVISGRDAPTKPRPIAPG